MLIQAQQLAYTYAPGTPLARPALRGVDVEIGPGERVGILGPTGSGKSTLVQLLAGLLAPTAGRVLLDGVAAHGHSAAARACRRRVGLAFQYPEEQIFEPTVFREVAFGPRRLRLPEAQVEERVRWALQMVGLEPATMEQRSPLSLSGGEMRRVALAGVLAMQPQVLILDEPAAGLDPQGRRELLARMRAWQEQVNGTLILVSHNVDDLARLVERAVVVAHGRIVADGPLRRVLSDSERLRAVGLDAPQTVTLLQALRRAGWPVRTDRLLPEEAAGEIARAGRLLEAAG